MPLRVLADVTAISGKIEFRVNFHSAQTTNSVEDSVNIFGPRRGKAPVHPQYAAKADFCQIFENDMNRLYTLSLLLTADGALAEKCFVAGLEDSKNSNPVFKEWAQSWARRTIVLNAIRLIAPRPTDIIPSGVTDCDRTQAAAVGAIVALPAFDRFAYVLSVLEGYSLHECAVLLNCRQHELITARMRALQQIVKSVEGRDAITAINSGNQPSCEDIQGDRLSQLAATA